MSLLSSSLKVLILSVSTFEIRFSCDFSEYRKKITNTIKVKDAKRCFLDNTFKNKWLLSLSS